MPLTLTKSFTVTSPNGGENWTAGSTYSITWNFSNGTSSSNWARLDYSLDNGATWNNITTAVQESIGANSYNWKIPTSVVTNL